MSRPANLRRRLIIAAACVAAAVGPAGVAEQQGERSELSLLLGGGGDAGFPKATQPRRFEFPYDHGPHPEYRNEWWYVTGNLEGPRGRRFGFELTIFRFALTPTPPPDDSRWRTNQVYIAHFAVSDPQNDRFLAAERYSRGALGLAGARRDPIRVWIDDWRIAADDPEARRWRLLAGDDEFSVDLALRTLKAPVLNGIDGLSQKSADPGNASYYYSLTRLSSRGTLRIGDDSYEVEGLSWMDREWGSSAIAGYQKGWDWFALQLSDGSDLMFYSLRTAGGTPDPKSAGTWVAKDGESRYIALDDIDLEVVDRWESPAGGTYPARWRLRLPARDLDVEIVPVMPGQELFTAVRYWEGAVDVRGTRAGQPVSGRGYVELTGYAESNNPPAD